MQSPENTKDKKTFLLLVPYYIIFCLQIHCYVPSIFIVFMLSLLNVLLQAQSSSSLGNSLKEISHHGHCQN